MQVLGQNRGNMSFVDTKSPNRKFAFLNVTAGLIFLAVAIFEKCWNWHGILSFIADVLFLIIGVREFKKAKKS